MEQFLRQGLIRKTHQNLKILVGNEVRCDRGLIFLTG
jgi:hypothetical protein